MECSTVELIKLFVWLFEASLNQIRMTIGQIKSVKVSIILLPNFRVRTSYMGIGYQEDPMKSVGF